MSGINKVILVGNVVNYHEIKHSSSNVAIISLLIATSEWWTDKNTGHKQEKTEWHNIKIFGKLAEEACYIFQGTKVYIEGRLQTNEYLDKTGTNRHASEIVVSSSSNGVIKRIDLYDDLTYIDTDDLDDAYIYNMANFDKEPF